VADAPATQAQSTRGAMTQPPALAAVEVVAAMANIVKTETPATAAVVVAGMVAAVDVAEMVAAVKKVAKVAAVMPVSK